VIEALAEFVRARPVLMMVTVRTGGLPDWVHRHALEPIVLQPLDDNGARALIDGLLGPAPALAALKQRVLDHTGRLPGLVCGVLSSRIGGIISPPYAAILGTLVVYPVLVAVWQRLPRPGRHSR
jgi:hypothetical protein